MTTLTAEDRSLVCASVAQHERWQVGREIELQGSAFTRPKVLLSGWACRQRIRSSGTRQIFDFILPGDFIGRIARPWSIAPATVTTITGVETAEMSPALAGPASLAASALSRALDCAQAEDEARLFDHLIRLGRLSAGERMAHLLLELHDRLARIGQAEDWKYTFPLTQEMLADALGLSIVHVNRTLQQLRREGMIEMRGGYVRLLQPAVLISAADYALPGQRS